MPEYYGSYRLYLRPLVPELIKGEYNVVLCLDCDTTFYPCYRELPGRQLLFMYGLKENHHYSEKEIEDAKRNEIILHYVNLFRNPWERGERKLHWVIYGESIIPIPHGIKKMKSGMRRLRKISVEKWR